MSILNDSDFQRIFEAVRAGKPVVIVDDYDRENEGDLVIAAECASAENINFMIQEGRGLICLSLTAERLDELRLPLVATENRSKFGTNFAVSFSHNSVKSAGPTASARAATIRAAIDPTSSYLEFQTPGWVYPLRAVEGGVLRRRGQTEASVDLARLAGLQPAGVICEIMDQKGEMLRGQALAEYCRKFELILLSVEDIKQFRLRNEASIRKTAEGPLPEILLPILGGYTPEKKAADIRVTVFVDDVDGEEHLAFTVGTPGEGSLVRIHSECLTGDVFDSERCDCGFQLNQALRVMVDEGSGVLIYLHQEGRGIGLANKLRAYALQDQGLDTVAANEELGFQADQRSYRAAAKMLSELGISSLRLLTNNPRKVDALSKLGITVVDRVPLLAPVTEGNRRYLNTKRERLGHLLPG